MTESVYLYAGIMLWGVVLGFCYFGGLWFTLRRLPGVKHQALWMLGSFILRNVLATAGFYAVIGWGWQSVLLCLAGFVCVRLLLIRRIKAPSPGGESWMGRNTIVGATSVACSEKKGDRSRPHRIDDNSTRAQK